MRNRCLMPLGLFLTAACLLLSACGSSSRPGIEAPPTLASQQPGQAASVSPEPTREPTPSPWAAPPVASEDPATLAAQLTSAELAIRDVTVTGPELAWKSHLQQKVYRLLVRRPDLHQAVLASLPESVRPAVRRNLDASLDLRALVTPGRDLPPWRIVEPAPAEELLAIYKQAETEFGIPWTYLASIHLVETVMGRIRGTSVAGAQGPMQFIPATWQAFGQGDINDNGDAIRAAARYLRASGAPVNMARALYAYNPSDRYVRAVTAYAEVMRAEPATFRGYYHWQVYFLTTNGDVHLPVGYGQ